MSAKSFSTYTIFKVEQLARGNEIIRKDEQQGLS